MLTRFVQKTASAREAERTAAREGNVVVRDQLDDLVVTMELTLISIIQGVMLYFLIESSRGLITDAQIARWPFIAVGLLAIFVFWSRSLIHSFTVIRWPLEFIHNFIYIACALLEAVMFTQLGDLQNWFLLGATHGIVVWVLFIFDFGMLRSLRTEMIAANPKLYAMLERDQLTNVRVLMPMFIAFHLVAVLVVRLFPVTTTSSFWVTAIGATQLLGGIIYLTYVLRLFRRLSPLIAGWRARQRALTFGSDGAHDA